MCGIWLLKKGEFWCELHKGESFDIGLIWKRPEWLGIVLGFHVNKLVLVFLRDSIHFLIPFNMLCELLISEVGQIFPWEVCLSGTCISFFPRWLYHHGSWSRMQQGDHLLDSRWAIPHSSEEVDASMCGLAWRGESNQSDSWKFSLGNSN